MGEQRSYSWEFKLQMVQLLEMGEHNPSQISRDHHVTRSLLYVLWQFYPRARGSGLCANPSVSKATRSGSTAQCARTNYAFGETVWTTGPRTRSPAIGGRCAKKSLASAPI